jgi:hypothetical protein
MGNGEVLKQSLADDAGLDKDVVSVKLSLDVVAVLERGTMERFCRKFLKWRRSVRAAGIALCR